MTRPTDDARLVVADLRWTKHGQVEVSGGWRSGRPARFSKPVLIATTGGTVRRVRATGSGIRGQKWWARFEWPQPAPQAAQLQAGDVILELPLAKLKGARSKTPPAAGKAEPQPDRGAAERAERAAGEALRRASAAEEAAAAAVERAEAAEEAARLAMARAEAVERHLGGAPLPSAATHTLPARAKPHVIGRPPEPPHPMHERSPVARTVSVALAAGLLVALALMIGMCT